MLILKVSFGKINIISVLFESGLSFKWKNGVSKKELATEKKDLECRRKNERERRNVAWKRNRRTSRRIYVDPYCE